MLPDTLSFTSWYFSDFRSSRRNTSEYSNVSDIIIVVYLLAWNEKTVKITSEKTEIPMKKWTKYHTFTFGLVADFVA